MELRIAPVIRFVTIVTALLKLTMVSCVPMKYEIGYRNSIDLDAEQTEARYDQGMLSDIMNDDRVELQKAESCVADNFKYDHGQKIQRYDPCEICLCIDGEIFCWWKQCDAPTKPELSGNPAAAIDTTSRLQLTNPSSTTSTTTTTASSVPSSDLSQLPSYQSQSGSLSTTTTTVTSSAIPSTTTTGSVKPDNSPAVLPSSSPDDAGGTAAVRILHPPPPESIPQNILSFPQTPPIMMYRPVVPGLAVKNGTGAAIPLLTGKQRNKHRPLKKVNPLHGGTGKKPFRKSLKSKDYAINYGQIDGSTGRMMAPPSMTERITSGPPVSFDEVAGRLTVGDRNDGQEAWRRKQEKDAEDAEDDDEDEDEDEEDDEEDDDGSAEAELRGQIYGGGGRVDESRTGSKDSSDNGDGGGGGVGDQFGGYGYGMFKEPDEDKQSPQHYIITSSGHVEMFDDDISMEATENAFGLNRFPVAGSGSSSTTGQPVAAASVAFGSEAVGSVHPVPPLITMTTNVTQNWNYSGQQQLASDGTSGQEPPPLTPYVPLAPSGGSVIDVLNSTEGVEAGGGGGGLDYLDDNQTELIYPAVPGLSSGSEMDSRRGAGSDRQTGPVTTSTTTTTTTTTVATGASDSASSLATSVASSAGRALEKHCVVMGVSYKVGSVLKQETGNCLHCVCVAGPENDPVPRVTCTPLNCPPLILPDILDGAGF